MKPISIINKLYESERKNIEDLGNKVVVFGGPGSDFGVLYKEDVKNWKAALKRRNIEILNISDDLTFTVRGKIKDIYDFYNKVVNKSSLGLDYNDLEGFVEWSGLLDQSSQNEILNSVPEQQEDEVDWKALKVGLDKCTSQLEILDLMEKCMSDDTYTKYWARFSRRQKSNSYAMYWPYSTNKMKEVLLKIANQNLGVK